jgi:hypothetical protein
MGDTDINSLRAIREPVTTTSSITCSLSCATATLQTPKTDPTSRQRPTSPAIAGCWLLVAGCWLLVAGCWLLVAGCWLLVGIVLHTA